MALKELWQSTCCKTRDYFDMIKQAHTVGIEINPKLLGVLLTEQIGNTLRFFCFYTNGSVSQFNAPADENSESQRELFSALSVEPTCTSVIQEAAVQGRIYIQSDNQRWLYTLLNTAGNQLPLNADIGNLPWKVIWRSKEMEALQYRLTDGAEPSIALRYKINESENLRQAKKNHLFTNAVSPPRKMPHRWLYLNIGVMLLAVALVVAGTCYYTFKPKTLAARSVSAVNTNGAKAAAQAHDGYYLLYNHRISGPFPAETVADMAAAGLFNPDTMCRAYQSTVWVKLATAFPAQAQTH